jgi:hypothetical protein
MLLQIQPMKNVTSNADDNSKSANDVGSDARTKSETIAINEERCL